MGIEIGQFRSLVQFKINLPTTLGAGFNDSLFDFGQTRGYLKNTSGRRNLITGEIEHNNSYELYIRYQPYYSRNDLTVVIDGRSFTIETVQTMEEAKKTFLKFQLSEKQ